MKENQHFKTEKNSSVVTEGEGFTFIHAGNFEWQEEEKSLAASPLGIYGVHETYLAENQNLLIYPTAVPGSFISTPAHGIISIEHAELIKGSAPIDAIRVKVSGINGYDEKSAMKIRDLATELEDQGFTVDIVAGSSHQTLTIKVEEIGDVIQSWTSLGAADTIIQSWNVVSIVLVILFTSVSFVYFLYSAVNMLKERLEDELQLKHLGWSKKHIHFLRYKELIGLIGFPGVFAFLCLYIISFIYQIRGSLFWLAIILSVMIVLLLLLPIIINKSKYRKVIKRRKLPILIHNILYHKGRITVAAIQLALLTFTTIFLLLLLQHEEQRTIKTTLGIYIHGQMDIFYFILITLIFTLACLTVVETLVSLWRLREDEFKLFYQIGWGKWRSYQFYMKEVCLWVFPAILLGALVSAIGYYIFTGLFFNIYLVTLLIVSILIFVMILAVLVFSYTLRKYTAYWDWKDVI
ncbi:hypothetical protein ACERII_23250 [Evansella sp. AB-rgal1]|uniref:hypothetical protein n=1 Tax=Evansella sp. AB-rgal1 TaxID=3242696 RepID=UPI00359D54EF